MKRKTLTEKTIKNNKNYILAPVEVQFTIPFEDYIEIQLFANLVKGFTDILKEYCPHLNENK